ncbi:NADH dehydrogenase [ubiquinone] 1 beta subcomplex subunit 1 isoform X1 [Pteropus vampyrus]|uniref:NADH dehydrogenase [ubiquinone] 1 beta subcomplex subunit 1 n=1 Tax=Pteropus vampyrus TaxID=132908 RepID=A0A6P6D3D4_PTEVA|nr:NADH dehydrogenase [ubiquinone] 1 beta subcomplex subunit 1 isoform X1 [Pteropus vampyrus]
MVFLCHPSLPAGAVNGRSRDPGFRRRWRLGSPLPLVVGRRWHRDRRATCSPASSTRAFTMNLIQIVRDHWVHVLVPMGFVIGCYLDGKNDEKLTAFRNKSLLFKRELRPHEEVTWK